MRKNLAIFLFAWEFLLFLFLFLLLLLIDAVRSPTSAYFTLNPKS